jgi:hypothetical protein
MADEWTVERDVNGRWSLAMDHEPIALRQASGDVAIEFDEVPGCDGWQNPVGILVRRTVPAAFLAAALRELGWTVTAPVTCSRCDLLAANGAQVYECADCGCLVCTSCSNDGPCLSEVVCLGCAVTAPGEAKAEAPASAAPTVNPERAVVIDRCANDAEFRALCREYPDEDGRGEDWQPFADRLDELADAWNLRPSGETSSDRHDLFGEAIAAARAAMAPKP